MAGEQRTNGCVDISPGLGEAEGIPKPERGPAAGSPTRMLLTGPQAGKAGGTILDFQNTSLREGFALPFIL